MKPKNENAPNVTSIRGANQNHNPAGLQDHSTLNADEGIVEGYEYFPPGRYSVTFESHDFINPQGLGHRIILWFAISDGTYAGCLVPFFCKVRIINRKNGSFTSRKGAKYLKTMSALTGRPIQRLDRFPPSLLMGMKLLAEVITVAKRKDGEPYPREDWYSKIESLEHDS